LHGACGDDHTLCFDDNVPSRAVVTRNALVLVATGPHPTYTHRGRHAVDIFKHDALGVETLEELRSRGRGVG